MHGRRGGRNRRYFILRSLGVIVALAVVAREQLVGSSFIGDDFFLAVPVEALAVLEGCDGEHAHRCCLMAFFDVAGGETIGGDGIEEVFPEFTDVLAIGGVELRLDVDGGLFCV